MSFHALTAIGAAFSGARQREVLAGEDVCVVDMSLNGVHFRDKKSKNGNDKRVRLGPRRRHCSREPVHDSRLSAPNGRRGRFKSAPEYRRYAPEVSDCDLVVCLRSVTIAFQETESRDGAHSWITTQQRGSQHQIAG